MYNLIMVHAVEKQTTAFRQTKGGGCVVILVRMKRFSSLPSSLSSSKYEKDHHPNNDYRTVS